MGVLHRRIDWYSAKRAAATLPRREASGVYHTPFRGMAKSQLALSRLHAGVFHSPFPFDFLLAVDLKVCALAMPSGGQAPPMKQTSASVDPAPRPEVAKPN